MGWTRADPGQVVGLSVRRLPAEARLARTHRLTRRHALDVVFHQTDGAPVTKGLELLPGSSALNRAAREIAQAKQAYLACLDKFGTNQWVSDAPIEAIIDTDLPAWMREDVEESV